MNEKIIQEIIENVTGNLLLFPQLVNGMVPFRISDSILAFNNTINLSVALSIKQKRKLNAVLSLKILKYDASNKTYKTFKLKDITLDDKKDQLKYSTLKIVPEESLEEFIIRKNYTFYFDQIPIDGFGRYAIVLLIDQGKNFYPLASYYFDVKDSSEYQLGKFE